MSYFVIVPIKLVNGLITIIVCNDRFIYQCSKFINVISNSKIIIPTIMAWKYQKPFNVLELKKFVKSKMWFLWNLLLYSKPCILRCLWTLILITFWKQWLICPKHGHPEIGIIKIRYKNGLLGILHVPFMVHILVFYLSIVFLLQFKKKSANMFRLMLSWNLIKLWPHRSSPNYSF
jgi:hypothetical protein